MKEVAIIGGGFSGVACGAAGKKHGFKPTIFEQRLDIGGVWRPDNEKELGGAAWPGMQTNGSNVIYTFADFPWPPNTPDFPNKEQIYQYLCDYVDFHQLSEFINLGCKVIKITNKEVEQKWHIQWRGKDNQVYQKDFDAVFIASGRYCDPFVPAFTGLSKITTLKCHSAEFRNPLQYRHKKVLVVGGSPSGASIAEEIARVTKVVHLIRRERWLYPRSIPCDPEQAHGPLLPHDLFLSEFRSKSLSNPEKRFAYMLQHCHRQNTIPEWQMFPHSQFGTVIVDKYVDYVSQGQILPQKGEIHYFTENKVYLTDGQEIEFDAVIFCTGYQSDLSFLPADIQEPVAHSDLYEDIFLPQFDNLAFIGLFVGFRGSLPPIAQLQAELACHVIGQKIKLPNAQDRKQKIKKTPKIRDGIEYLNSLAEYIKVKPDLNNFNLGEQYILNSGTFTVQRFFLHNPDDRDNAWKAIKQNEMQRRERIQANDIIPSLAKLCKKTLGLL